MSRVNVNDAPAATETVVVDPPVSPPTLHLMSVEVKSVTGELPLVFFRT